MEEVKKPTRKDPAWHLKLKYVDDNGDVYSKGKFVGQAPVSEITQPLNQVENDINDTIINDDDSNPKVDIIPEPVVEKPKKVVEKEIIKEPETSVTSLQKQLAQQQALINDLLLKQSGQVVKNDLEKRGYTQTKDIPREDYQEVKETFITRGRGTIISCYEKEGKWYYPPYGMPPVFEYYYTDLNRKGKDVDILHFSIFSTHSKKEIEYIKESPFFGTTIFNEAAKAVKYSSEMYEKMQNLTAWAARLDGDKLFNQAIGMGIKIQGKGKEEIKLEIVSVRLSQLQTEERKIQESRVARLSEAEIFNTQKK